MFIVTWLFDKLGYMPKINMEVGMVNQTWPFPVEITSLSEKPKRPYVRKATTRKPKLKDVSKPAKKK
jgi:hypothetical protein